VNHFLNRNPNEGEAQRYLERHSTWLPTPYLLGHGLHYNAFIAQFELDRDRITDFAYLTKNTAGWCAVLVELESPAKRIFTKSARAEFHSHTQKAINQIEDWKTAVSEHLPALKERLMPLLAFSPDFARNPLSFRYVLVVGRNPKGRLAQREAALVKRLDNERAISLLSYDSLYRHEYMRFPGPRVILRHRPNGFVIDRPADTSIFAHLTTEHLSISKAARRWYIRNGYDIPAWEAGRALPRRVLGTRSLRLRRD
jgi:hypothetical protein